MNPRSIDHGVGSDKSFSIGALLQLLRLLHCLLKVSGKARCLRPYFFLLIAESVCSFRSRLFCFATKQHSCFDTTNPSSCVHSTFVQNSMPLKSKPNVIDDAKQEYYELVNSNRDPGVDLNTFIERRLREKQPELAYSNRLSSLHSQKAYHKKMGHSTVKIERQISQLKSSRTSFIAQHRANMTTNGYVPPVPVAAAPFVAQTSNPAHAGASSGFSNGAHADFNYFVSSSDDGQPYTSSRFCLGPDSCSPVVAHPLSLTLRISTSRLGALF